MANHTTRAQRRNARMDKIFDRAKELNATREADQALMRRRVEAFAAEWEAQEGYAPASFQKAIATQRLARGESIDRIIAALVAQRI